jgi:hypothetical protein
MGSPSFGLTGGSNPFINEYLKNRIDGKSMRALKIEREALSMSLKAQGIAKPATILNFNPLMLRLDGGVEFSVPTFRWEGYPQKEIIPLKYKGKDYRATSLTIREPWLYPQITDVKKEEDVEVGVYKMMACKQIEIAHSFLISYTFGSPNSSGMGGVVVFEGDRKSLNVKKKDPDTGQERVVVKVPKYVTLPNKSREYFTEERWFDEVIKEALDMQQRYCQLQTQQAQSFWDQGEDHRGNITEVHRVWHQYEMDMGWRTNAAPWITLMHENAATCEGCGEPKKRATAFFCHKCARPYEPMAAYMAGEIGIDHPALNRVPVDQWPAIRTEEKRRRELREGTTEQK